MTYSANIYKYILSKPQSKVSTDGQRKLPSTPAQHGTSSCPTEGTAEGGSWDSPQAHWGGCPAPGGSRGGPGPAPRTPGEVEGEDSGE